MSELGEAGASLRYYRIQIYAEKAGKMTMGIYNMDSKPVFRVNRSMTANETYTHAWNISNVANGVYFARIFVEYEDGGKDRKTVKIAVLR